MTTMRDNCISITVNSMHFQLIIVRPEHLSKYSIDPALCKFIFHKHSKFLFYSPRNCPQSLDGKFSLPKFSVNTCPDTLIWQWRKCVITMSSKDCLNGSAFSDVNKILHHSPSRNWMKPIFYFLYKNKAIFRRTFNARNHANY